MMDEVLEQERSALTASVPSRMQLSLNVRVGLARALTGWRPGADRVLSSDRDPFYLTG